MATAYLSWAWCVFFLCVQALPQSRPTSRDAAQLPVWNSCGNLIRKANAPDNPFGIVNASDVYDCWTTVPFNVAVGTRFLKYWNDTLQFQSTLEFLKKPPQGYQKPAVDLIAELQQIQNTVDAGGYSSQYDFEADFQRLLYSANDDHVSLNAGLLSSFQFANPYSLTTLSLDGVALPKVYSSYDLFLNKSKGPQETWQPSAIAQINGRDATEYLSEFASLNSGGTLEPHSDWNTMMDSPVNDVLLTYTTFQGAATFYPGDEFTFKFENGTEITDKWLAIYSDGSDTGPLETGGDFYNFFVLGFFPASFVPPNVTATEDDSPPLPVVTSFSNLTDAYPSRPDVYQANLTIDGFVTGYFFQDKSLAVLSIPTFVAEDATIQAFSDTVQQFIDQAKARGMQKVVIDLQENHGGDVLLAYNTFKQFFPSITPLGASNRRSFPLANVLGSTITDYCGSLSPSDPDYETCAGIEWNALVVLNSATNRNFSSWPELFGPVNTNVDAFSLTQRLDIQSYTYDFVNLDYAAPPAPLFATSGASPWAASDIIILSDAMCSSACSLFLEFMRFDAGVKNVVLGGRPSNGPMQTPGLSRAARFYSTFEMDTDFANVLAIDETAVVPDRFDNTLFTNFAGISLRNQVGPNSEVPFQMQYQAADCRIFLTPSTFYNFTNLWHYAADAIWFNSGKCVQGSTGQAPTNGSTPSAPGQAIPAGVNYNSNGVISSGNKTAHAIPLLYDHSGPQPDVVLPVNLISRTAVTPVRVDPRTNLRANRQNPQQQPTQQQTTQKSREQQLQNFCGFEQATAQCSSAKKKRSMEATVRRAMLKRRLR